MSSEVDIDTEKSGRILKVTADNDLDTSDLLTLTY